MLPEEARYVKYVKYVLAWLDVDCFESDWLE